MQHLVRCYVESLKHLDHPDFPAAKGQHVIEAIVRKSPVVAARARAFILTCQSLEAQGSSLSPLMWTWWMLGFLRDKGVSLYAPKAVWSSKIESPRMRRFFYDDVGASAWSGAPLWPAAASQLLTLWRKLSDKVLRLERAEARALWDTHLPQYEALLRKAREQREVIAARVAKHAAKLDLGLWLAKDPNTYLRLNKRARILGTKG